MSTRDDDHDGDGNGNMLQVPNRNNTSLDKSNVDINDNNNVALMERHVGDIESDTSIGTDDSFAIPESSEERLRDHGLSFGGVEQQQQQPQQQYSGTSFLSFAEEGGGAGDSMGTSLVSFATDGGEGDLVVGGLDDAMRQQQPGGGEMSLSVVEQTPPDTEVTERSLEESFVDEPHHALNDCDNTTSHVKQTPPDTNRNDRTIEKSFVDVSHDQPCDTFRTATMTSNSKCYAEEHTTIEQDVSFQTACTSIDPEDQLNRDVIIGSTSNISRDTTATQATTHHSNSTHFLGATESDFPLEKTEDDIIEPREEMGFHSNRVKRKALRVITDAFGPEYQMQQQRDEQIYEPDEQPLTPVVMLTTALDTHDMEVVNEESAFGECSDDIDIDNNSFQRRNPFEDAHYTERNITPFDPSHVSHYEVGSQCIASREMFMDEPINNNNNALRVDTVHEKVRNMQTSLFNGSTESTSGVLGITSTDETISTDELIASLSSSSYNAPPAPITIVEKTHGSEKPLIQTAAQKSSLKRIIVFSVIALIGGFYGSFYAETSCHFATVSHYVGYYGQSFNSHIGMWQYSPIDSVFTGYSYCSSYDNDDTLTPPSWTRISGLIALLSGTFTMIVVWGYLFFVRTTEFLWRLARQTALVAGVLQASTLFFFIENVCRDNECGIGPGSVASMIASLSWFAMAFGMTSNIPSDATIIKCPCTAEDSTFAKRFGAGNVEMIPVSRSTADQIDPRAAMYRAPVFTDDYALV